MSVDPKFRAASEMAEQSLTWLTLAEEKIKEGQPADALACLKAVAVLGESELSQVLQDLREGLAGVGNIIRIHGPAGTLHHSSAHEAVESLWFKVAIRLQDNPDALLRLDLLDRLGVDPSALRAMLVRERAKLLKEAVPAVPQAEAAKPRLIADVDRQTITLDGTTYDVNSQQAVRWVKVLADHPGVWVSSPALKNHDPDLDGCRTDRLKEYLDKAVLSIIESETGKGSRIRLA